MKEYRNKFATVEKHGRNQFHCFNEVTGILVKTVYTWPEAKAFMVETAQHYRPIAAKFSEA